MPSTVASQLQLLKCSLAQWYPCKFWSSLPTQVCLQVITKSTDIALVFDAEITSTTVSRVLQQTRYLVGYEDTKKITNDEARKQSSIISF